MNYTKTNETRLGWHIEFDATITADNFKQACQAAIDLAKKECAAQNAIAINFSAQDIPVQVVESDTAEIQFELWQRWVAQAKKDIKQAAHEDWLESCEVRQSNDWQERVAG